LTITDEDRVLLTDLEEETFCANARVATVDDKANIFLFKNKEQLFDDDVMCARMTEGRIFSAQRRKIKNPKL